MHPVIKSAIYTFLAFAAVVALAYVNRDRIDRHYSKMEASYYRQLNR